MANDSKVAVMVPAGVCRTNLGPAGVRPPGHVEPSWRRRSPAPVRTSRLRSMRGPDDGS